MTDTPRTWRDVQAERQDPIDAALEAWFEDGGATRPPLRERMLSAMLAYEAAQAMRRICDEPGCLAQVTRGWTVHPSDGVGYRRTCEAHRCKEDARLRYQAERALAGLPPDGAV